MNAGTRRFAEVLDVLKAVALALFLSIGLNVFVVQVVDVRQSSMETTLMEGDRLFLSKVDYHFHPPARGDIIVFRPPPPACPADADCIPFVKRIIGVEGDQIDVRNGRVFLDGAPLAEPYAHEPTAPEGGITYPFVVPAGMVFVLGDNRPESGDSRAWGPVPLTNILGKAYVDFWPPSDIRWLLR